MMDIETLIKDAPDWTGGNWANRIDQAASLLFVHGYLTNSERSRVTTKLERQFKKAIAKGNIVERSPS